jgi:hypothetical protein
MSNTWIGNIIITNEDGIYNDEGDKALDLLECDGSLLDEELYPLLIGKLPVPSYTYSNTSFSVSSEEATPLGMTWDGSYFYIAGQVGDTVYQYDSDGLYTGFSFSAGGGGNVELRGLGWDGSSLWAINVSDSTAYQYGTDGVPTGISFSVYSEVPSPYGICFDGTNLWVCDGGGSLKKMYEYTLTGTPTGNFISFSTEIDFPADIDWDGTHFLVSDWLGDIVHKYTSSGDYVGVVLDASNLETALRAVVVVGEDLWVMGSATTSAYKYSSAYKTPTMTSPDANTPYKIVADLT